MPKYLAKAETPHLRQVGAHAESHSYTVALFCNVGGFDSKTMSHVLVFNTKLAALSAASKTG
eukprot:11235718-Karenia_brevis.AAC.1